MLAGLWSASRNISEKWPPSSWAGSATHKRKLRQITHIFTKCKLPPILLPYFTGMTCGLQFVFVFVHDYLFGPWIFPESPSLEAGLGLDGYTDMHKAMYIINTCCRVVPQPFKYPTCGCSISSYILTASPPLPLFPW